MERKAQASKKQKHAGQAAVHSSKQQQAAKKQQKAAAKKQEQTTKNSSKQHLSFIGSFSPFIMRFPFHHYSGLIFIGSFSFFLRVDFGLDFYMFFRGFWVYFGTLKSSKILLFRYLWAHRFFRSILE